MGTELAMARVLCQKNRPLKDQRSSAPKASLTSETGGGRGVQHKVERIESPLKMIKLVKMMPVYSNRLNQAWTFLGVSQAQFGKKHTII